MEAFPDLCMVKALVHLYTVVSKLPPSFLRFERALRRKIREGKKLGDPPSSIREPLSANDPSIALKNTDDLGRVAKPTSYLCEYTYWCRCPASRQPSWLGGTVDKFLVDIHVLVLQATSLQQLLNQIRSHDRQDACGIGQIFLRFSQRICSASCRGYARHTYEYFICVLAEWSSIFRIPLGWFIYRHHRGKVTCARARIVHLP